MSRHTYDDPYTQQRWHVGWDPATVSFFAQTEPAPQPEDQPEQQRERDAHAERELDVDQVDAIDPVNDDVDNLVEVVDPVRPGEVPTLDALDARLAGRTVLPTDVRASLLADQRAHLAGDDVTDRARAATAAIDEARQALQLSRAMFPTPAAHAATTYGDGEQQRDVVDVRGAELTGARGSTGADTKHAASHAVRRTRDTGLER